MLYYSWRLVMWCSGASDSVSNTGAWRHLSSHGLVPLVPGVMRPHHFVPSSDWFVMTGRCVTWLLTGRCGRLPVWGLSCVRELDEIGKYQTETQRIMNFTSDDLWLFVCASFVTHIPKHKGSFNIPINIHGLKFHIVWYLWSECFTNPFK